MKRQINSAVIEGRIYDFDLEVKTVSNASSANYGKNYIRGSISVAIDEDAVNVVQVYYTYVAPTYPAKNGKPERENPNFNLLKGIIEGGAKWVSVGKDAAQKVRLTPSIAENAFVGRDGNLVDAKRLEGGFINLVSSLNADKDKCNEFKADMIVLQTIRQEADPEAHRDKDVMLIKGYVFNFRNDVIPVEFKLYDAEGMDYFESLNVSNNNPAYMNITGSVETRIERTEHVTEYAFGGPVVDVRERTTRDWVITRGSEKEGFGASYGEDAMITEQELQSAIQAHNIYLAEVKKNNEEYRNSQNAGTSATATTAAEAAATIPTGQFTFNL